MNQKVGNGNLALIGVYGQQENYTGVDGVGGFGVSGTVTQLEVNYTFKPYAGVNFQPAIGYQKWDLERIDNGASTDSSNADRYAVRLRAWREF